MTLVEPQPEDYDHTEAAIEWLKGEIQATRLAPGEFTLVRVVRTITATQQVSFKFEGA